MTAVPPTPRIDPVKALLAHAASRSKMTKAALLKDAEACDDAYLNASVERDMAEAYLTTLREALLLIFAADRVVAKKWPLAIRAAITEAHRMFEEG